MPGNSKTEHRTHFQEPQTDSSLLLNWPLNRLAVAVELVVKLGAPSWWSRCDQQVEEGEVRASPMYMHIHVLALHRVVWKGRLTL